MIYFILGLGLIAYVFVMYIVRKDRGSKEPLGALIGAAGFGVLAALFAGELNNIFVPEEIILDIGGESLVNLSLSTIAFSALTIGVIEESLKALPLAYFIYKKGYFNEITDGVIYFGLAGLAFGTLETFFYALEFGEGVGFQRLVIVPYFHAGLTALFGLFLARKKLLSKSWFYVAIGLSVSVAIHSLYNFGLMSGIIFFILLSIVITLTINIMLFRYFKKAQRDDEARGMSATGFNSFCKNCGKPNPKRMLFCENCGKHT